MRLFLRCSFVVLFVLSVGSLGLAAPYRHPATGIVFPDRIGSLVKQADIHDYEKSSPGLGVSVGYNAPGTTVTIYLYTASLDAIPEDLSAPTLREHFARTVGDVFRAGELGQYADVRKIAEDRIVWSEADDAARSLHAHFSYRQRGRQRLSHLDLLGVKNHFLKIRYTYDETVAGEAETDRRQLLDTLDRALRALDK